MVQQIHPSRCAGSGEAGVQSRLLSGAASSSGVGLPSDDAEEHQASASRDTDNRHSGSKRGRAEILLDLSRSDTLNGSACYDVGLFREAELAKRRRNVLKRFSSIGSGDQVGNQIFLSHCWRSGEHTRQQRKFDMFSSLTQARREGGPGLIFWADFLDLHADGPVPWRREIEIAIQQCSKMVCFIDQDYLLSFNCLQELAYAVKYNKPLVVVMLDQGAWDLLTMMGGPEAAWDMQPTNGAALRNFEGVELIPGNPFTHSALSRLFNTLSSINFCACRELDFANLGRAAVFHNLCKFVVKDLEYANEHSWLQHRALQWMMQDYHPSHLLNRSESSTWADWCEIGLKAGVMPAPTKLQLQYVKASKASVAKSRRLMKFVAVMVMALILAGGIVAGAMAVRASNAERAARASEAEAQLAKGEAVAARSVAELNARVALEHAEIAEEQKRLMAARERQVALLLLSTARLPRRSDEVRAVLQATEVALLVNEQPLVHPALHAAVKFMTSMPYIFWELEGHTNWVRAVAFSPDNKALASASDDGTVRVWPIGKSTGAVGVPAQENATVLTCDGSRVLSVQWSPNGTHIAAGTRSGSICVWRNLLWEYWQYSDAPSSSWNHSAPLLIRTAHRNDIHALVFVSDGQYLVTGGNDDRLLLWDLRPSFTSFDVTPGNGATVDKVFPLVELSSAQDGDVRSLAYCSGAIGGQSLLASGANDESIVIWDLSDPRAPKVLTRYEHAHEDDINALAFSSDGSLLASGSDDTSARVWRVVLPRNHTPAALLDIDQNETSNSSSSLIPPPSLQPLRPLPLQTASVRAVAWSANGILAVVTANALTRLYRQSELVQAMEYREGPTTKDCVGTARNSGVEIEPFETLDGRDSLFTSAAWSPDGNQLATGSAGDRIRVWKKSVDLGGFGPQMVGMACHQKRDSVRSVSWTNDAYRVAAGSTDATVCIWERDSDDGWRHDPTVHALRGHTRAVRGLAWSEDVHVLASADDRGVVIVWTFDGVKWLPRRFDDLEGKGAVRCVAFSRDTSLLAAGSFGNTVGVWHLESDAFVELGGAHSADSPSNIPAGPGAASTAKYSTDDGHTGSVRAVAWAPVISVGETPRWRLASGGADDLIVVWEFAHADLLDGRLKLVGPPIALRGHSSTVRSVQWSIEGRLASSSDDDTVRLWDEIEVANNNSGSDGAAGEKWANLVWNLTLTLEGHHSNVRSVSWSPRGTHIASSGLDSRMTIWRVVADAGVNKGGPNAWRIDDDCQWSRWLHTVTVKLACARQSRIEDHSFEMEMLMVDFRQQSKLLRQMTYGQLSKADLAALGYPMLEWVLDLVPNPKEMFPDGVNIDFLPLRPDSDLPIGELGSFAGNFSRSGVISGGMRPPSFIGNETLNY